MGSEYTITAHLNRILAMGNENLLEASRSRNGFTRMDMAKRFYPTTAQLLS